MRHPLRRITGKLRRSCPTHRILMVILTAWILLNSCSGLYSGKPEVVFTAVSDMRNYLGNTEFQGTARAIKRADPGDFIISIGDIDPPANILKMIRDEISDDIDWYPGVGNHEAETVQDMSWLRTYNATGWTLPGIVNAGPSGSIETCYSFDVRNVHVVVLNEYYDGVSDVGTDGDVCPALLSWLDADLAGTSQPAIIVFGHEPAFPQPEMEEPHSIRHEGDSLDQYPSNRNAFWQVLVNYGVDAYVCGHTHGYSHIKIDGVWQIDDAHGAGTAYTSARSTFIRFIVTDEGDIGYETWRQRDGCTRYEIADMGWL
jgi:hypothetical protein